MRQSNPLASNAAMGPTALRPATAVSHVAAAPIPMPLTGPNPEIITRRAIAGHFRELRETVHRDRRRRDSALAPENHLTRRAASGQCILVMGRFRRSGTA